MMATRSIYIRSQKVYPSVRIFLAIVCAIWSLSADAQVRFKVFNSATSVPVSSVKISLLDTSKQQVLEVLYTDVLGAANTQRPFPFFAKLESDSYDEALYYVNTPEAMFGMEPTGIGLNEVVVTGLIKPVLRRNAISNITTISAQTIQQLGANTLDQALAFQPNITIGQDPVLGGTIRMQGMSGDKVKVLIDGVPLNGREAGNINLNQVNLNNVERIEIVNGPMSLQYGSDALSGVINVVTKTITQKKYLKLQALMGSIGRYDGYLQGQHAIGKRHAVGAGIGRNFSEGFKFLDTGMYRRRMLFKPVEQYPFHFLYSYRAPSGFHLKFATDGMHEKIIDRGSPEVSSSYARAQDQYFNTRRLANRLQATGNLGNVLSWQSNLSYMHYQRSRRTYTKDMVSLQMNPIPIASLQDTSVYQDINHRTTINQNFKRLSYSIGYDINLSYAESKKIEKGEAAIHDFGLWLSMQYHLWQEKLTLSAGARAAANSQYEVPVLPTVQLLYKPHPSLQLRANYAKAYRAPSLKELFLEFIDPQHRILGNKGLKAEEGNHFQVAMVYQALQNKKGDYLQLSLNGFHNRVINQISLVPSNPLDTNSIDYSYANVAKVQNYIANLQCEMQVSFVYLMLGYNHGYTYLPNSGNNFKDYSIQANTVLNWKKARMNFAAFYKYYSPQPFLRGYIDGTADFDGMQGGYHLADASVTKNLLGDKIQVTLGIQNIFNTTNVVVSGTSISTKSHASSSSINFLPRRGFVGVQLHL